MKVITGDLFQVIPEVRAICITTNSTLKKNGEGVMGAGIALEAKKRWPEMPMELAGLIKQKEKVGILGNKLINGQNVYVLSFQTKTDWRLPSSIKLIIESATELKWMAGELALSHEGSVWLPPPGCGNGGLQWKDVEATLSPILDDRFTVVFKTRTIPF